MPKKKLSQDVIDSWPEVFEDIELEAVPLEYLNAIHVTFTNNNVWVIEFKDQEVTPEYVNSSLQEIISEYQSEIINIDFKLDTHKVKHDIQKRTKYFLKKKK